MNALKLYISLVILFFSNIGRATYVGGNPMSYVDPTGLYTQVTVWQPVGYGTSSFGHVSIDINGSTFTFAPGGLKNFTTAEYVAKNTLFRSGVGLSLNLTKTQEANLLAYFKKYNKGYNAVSNNCVDPVQEGLKSVGVDIGNSFFPVSVGYDILNSPLMNGVVHYTPVGGK